jgi:ubiquitin C-terminal hydrolase
MAPVWWKKPYQAPSIEDVTALRKLCAICGKSAQHRCKNCSGVGYCGRPCQIKHWQEHKHECAALKERIQAAVQLSEQQSKSVSPTSPPATLATPPSNAVIPIAATELYPYDAFIQHWKSTSLSGRIPAGIYNLGNTCYENAILQVLLATRPVAGYLLAKEHTCPSPPENLHINSKKQWCPLCSLISLAQHFFDTNSAGGGGNKINGSGGGMTDPLSIRYFTHFVHHLNSSFTFGDQHDAQELYVALLDTVECVLLREFEATTTNGAAILKNMDQFSKQTTFMNHVFTCYVRTQVKCKQCGTVSKSYATDTGIMLSVPNDDKEKVKTEAFTLKNLLENFTAVEVLEGEDAYRCDACCARVTAHKSNVIEIAPNILAIQLSRVGMNFFSTGQEKNSAAVEFPIELDLTPFMATDAIDATSAVYDLYAVVTHEGSTTEDGHYLSVVRYGGGTASDGNTDQGQWYVCDDDVVSPLDVDIVLKQKEEAYLLFYERRQPRVQQLLCSSNGDSRVDDGVSNGVANGVANEEPQSEEETVEKCITTLTEQVKACYASANGAEEEREGPLISYVFQVESGKNGARALRLQVMLPRVDEEPQIEIHPGKPVFVEVSCGGDIVLRIPLPVAKAVLPARQVEWNKDGKVLDVLFDLI